MAQGLQNPFLRGMLASQAAGQQQTMGNLQALSGLLSVQKAAQEQQEGEMLRQAVVMGPNGQLDPSQTLANIYKVNPVLGVKFQTALQKESNFGKVDPKDYTPESISRFSQTRNHADLVPVRKSEYLSSGTHFQPINPYTNELTGMPIPIGVSPNTQATLDQGQRQFDVRLPLERARVGADLSRLYYDTGMGPTGVPGGNLLPPPMSAPSPNAAPSPASAPISPAGGWQIPPAVQAARDADARRIVQAENNGGAGMIPTRNVIPDARVPTDPITQQITNTRPQPALTPRQQAERTAKAPERIQSIRKEFDDVPEVKNYRTVVPIIESARNAPDTPAGDLDLIYAVGKILDPTSVVREGEMNLVIKSGSPLQRVVGNINYIMAGRGRLPADQRAELTKMLDTRVSQLESGYNNAVNLFTRTAEAEGLPLDQIIRQPPQRRASDKGNPALEFNGYRFPSLEQLNAYKKALGAQ